MTKTWFPAIVALMAAWSSCNRSTVVVADFNVIPLPDEITAPSDSAVFSLHPDSRIVYSDTSLQTEAELLSEYLHTGTGLEIKAGTSSAGKGDIILRVDSSITDPEGYWMKIYPDSITICGGSEAGVFYGAQTLRKATPHGTDGTVVYPTVTVTDSPRFAYRGVLLDASRHFFPADSVKRFIDMLALHNINRLHWHLSDDQGWRIEIKSRPCLTEIGSMRPETVIGHNTPQFDGTPHGGYYTQEQVRDIVNYAAERHITIVPEIDLPGHMQAALASYPELGCTGGPYEVWKMWGVSDDVLCAGNPETYRFIEDVLGEIVDMFPSEYIHIGGDECPKTKWAACPKCQKAIKDNGIRSDSKHTAEQRLQSHVISHVEKFLNDHGRKIIGWDEILEGGLTPGATVMSWRGEEGGIEAAGMGHDVIMTPNEYLYLDYFQTGRVEDEPDAFGGLVTVEKIYDYEPVPASLQADRRHNIIGVQGCLWTTYIPDLSLAQYMSLPRIAALAEVQWADPATKDFTKFASRLERLSDIYQAEGYRYATHVFNPSSAFSVDPESKAIMATLSTATPATIRYTLDGSDPTTASDIYTAPIAIRNSCVLRSKAFRPGMESSIITDTIYLHKAALKNIELLQTTHPKWGSGGAAILVDGLKGNANYHTGRWLGFRGNDLEAVIDFGVPTELKTVNINTCVVKNDWTFDTRGIEVYASDDKKSYRKIASEEYPLFTWDKPDGVYRHTVAFSPVTTRYLKVKVKSEQRPEGYQAHGEGYMFVDEIDIE